MRTELRVFMNCINHYYYRVLYFKLMKCEMLNMAKQPMKLSLKSKFTCYTKSSKKIEFTDARRRNLLRFRKRNYNPSNDK